MDSSIDRFGNLLAGFIRESQKAGSSPPLELGTLNADGSLSVDSLSRSIPKGEYMVGRHLQGDTGNIPRRVLIAWVGVEPIVVDIVVSS
ncbi:MAG: hypothetical protein HFF00_04700 [Ruminiclostridium sp.]|jgi:hypothetical protein|nr:hypothetical protein [Ruminiclostridium sp.]